MISIRLLGVAAISLGLLTTVTSQAEAGFVTTAPPGASVETFGGLPSNGSTPSPIVLGGNTFTVDPDSVTFRVLDYGSPLGMPLSNGIALGTNSDLGYIDVTLGTTRSFVGASISGSNFTFDVFGVGGNLLGSTTGLGSNVTPFTFIGFQADAGTLITRVRFTDTASNATILILDNFTTAAATVPEPSSLALCGVGSACVGLLARRSRRAA